MSEDVSLRVIKDAWLIGLGYGTRRQSVVGLLGEPDLAGALGVSDDMHWGDLAVVFQNDQVLYVQISVGDSALELPPALQDAEFIQELPTSMAAFTHMLDSASIPYFLVTSQGKTVVLSTRSPMGKLQVSFHGGVLVELLFSWPQSADEHI